MHWPLGLLLHHDRTIADTPARHNVANPHLDYVAAAQLAVDRKVEQRPVPQTPMLIEPEADCPYLLLFERPLGAQDPALVPGATLMSAENVALIRSLYEAFAAGEIGSVLALMQPGIVWNEAENFLTLMAIRMLDRKRC